MAEFDDTECGNLELSRLHKMTFTSFVIYLHVIGAVVAHAASQIDDLGCHSLVNYNIMWLEVSMADTHFVHKAQSFCDQVSDFQPFSEADGLVSPQ